MPGQAPKKPDKEPSPEIYRSKEQTDNGNPSSSNQSIHDMTTDEWRSAYEQEGCVDLWVEEEFNSGSRLMVCQPFTADLSQCITYTVTISVLWRVAAGIMHA